MCLWDCNLNSNPWYLLLLFRGLMNSQYPEEDFRKVKVVQAFKREWRESINISSSLNEIVEKILRWIIRKQAKTNWTMFLKLCKVMMNKSCHANMVSSYDKIKWPLTTTMWSICLLIKVRARLLGSKYWYSR